MKMGRAVRRANPCEVERLAVREQHRECDMASECGSAYREEEEIAPEILP